MVESVFAPVSYVLEFLASYGWFMVGAAAAALYATHKLKPVYQRWKEAREDAAYHKNPDLALARMAEIQRARERQQQMLLEASRRAAEEQREREERKRLENLELLEKYGTTAGGNKTKTLEDKSFLPLMGGGASSSYRPPKRSACGGGGCGR
ncbi:hypothetical protein O0L34_g11957 [Tuta absoluta]|nr:hypothetical protein O0L34_g11957 [Tuta absoluta]